MFTPLELEKIEFGTAFMGGYKKQDVEEVFDELTRDYETLYKENISNKDKLSMLEGLVDKYKTMEDSLQNALLLAQTSSDAAIRAAQDKAQNIVKEAEAKAAYIIKEAEEKVKALAQQELDMKRNISVFAARNVSQLRTQIEILNGMVSGTKDAAPAFGTETVTVSAPVSPVVPEHIPAPSPMEDTQIAGYGIKPVTGSETE